MAHDGLLDAAHKHIARPLGRAAQTVIARDRARKPVTGDLKGRAGERYGHRDGDRLVHRKHIRGEQHLRADHRHLDGVPRRSQRKQ
jgi:hypothetical protein